MSCNRTYFTSCLVLLLVPILGVGCSSKVQGKGKGRSGAPPALLYQQGGLPGIRHAAHPDAPEEAPGVPAREATPPPEPPLTCSQGDLEEEAGKTLTVWLRAPGLSDAAPLPPDRPPHLDPVELTRFALSLARRHPDARKDTGSFRATASLRLRYAPEHDAEEVGLLQKGSRLPVTGFVSRTGCRAGWLVLAPNAYVCLSQVQLDARPPALAHLPRIPEGRITPGDYGYIRPGGAPAYASRTDAEKRVTTRRLPAGFFIRFGLLARIKDQNYWKTTKGLYVPIDRIARHVPSRFHGFRLQGEAAPGDPTIIQSPLGSLARRVIGKSRISGKSPASPKAASGVLASEGEPLRLPLAIVRLEGPGKRGIPVYHQPGQRRTVGRLHRYTAMNLLGTLVRPNRHGRSTRYLRIGPCQWIEARATRVAHREAPPPGVTAGERWIDVDLERQVLVAYEGRDPVFATLIATGKKGHDTRHGIFRVYWKVAEVDMANEAGADEEYLAEAVPWSMFFWKGQALHGAYWHDSFGRPRSHGCINLSPLDAQFLFEWSTPTLPAGWKHSWHGERFPGTLVQVRRRRGEQVRYLGLARKLAPKEAVAARDEAFKRRVQLETLEMLGGSRPEEDEDDGEESGKAPDPAPRPTAPRPTAPGAPSPSAAAPPGASAPSVAPMASPPMDDLKAPKPASQPKAASSGRSSPRPRSATAMRPRSPSPRGGLRPGLRPLEPPPPPPGGRR